MPDVPGMPGRDHGGMDTLMAADLVREDGAARRTWPWIALVAAAAFGAELAVSARYGYVRDELYFLAAGHHLAFGYVDQPPLTPVLARLAELAGGGTLTGFRVLPALVLAAVVVLTAGMSRALARAGPASCWRRWPSRPAGSTSASATS